MKKYLIAAASVLLPVSAFAQQLTGIQNLVQSIGRIINLLIPIVFALAMLYFFWGLAQYILNAGDDAKEQAKTKMVWGIVALFVMSAVWGIIRFIGNALDVQPGATPGFTPGQLVPRGTN